jgi:c-di-GMP-binding flagellar brake protein YcgR
MPEIGPERLVARDPCKLKVGLLGKRGKLSLYPNRILFSTSSGSSAQELALERLEWVELRGRKLRLLALGFEGGESVFELDQAKERFGQIVALLVQLHPTPPWLDERFGQADPEAVAAFLEPFDEALQPRERMLLCEWCLAWRGDTHVRCGWLALTGRRILFLPVSSGPKRIPARSFQPKLIERVDPADVPSGQLCFVTDDAFQRFEPCGSASFTREFWRACDAPLYQPRDGPVRRGQSLARLQGDAPLVRIARTAGADLTITEVLLEPRDGLLQTRFRIDDLPPVSVGEEFVVEVIKRAGLFRFEARVRRAEPIEDGPFRATMAMLELEPTSDINFVNRRQAFRVEVSIPIHVQVRSPQPDGDFAAPVSTLFRMADLSNTGCALVGPRGIHPDSRFSFDLPLGPEEGLSIPVQAECVHVLSLPGTSLSQQYGCHIVGVSQRARDQIQQEVIRQERLMLQRRSRIKR